MHRKRTPRLGTLGVIVALIGVGIPGEYASDLDHSQATTRADRVGTLTDGIFQGRPAVSIPMLWGARWTDSGPAGVRIEVQVDTVSRRPRRVGALTFKSFQEVVAAGVQVRMGGQKRAADRDHKPDSAFTVFSRLQGRLVGLYAMAHGELYTEPDQAGFFTRTFLGGVVFENLLVEIAQDGGVGVGRLRSRTMSTAPGGLSWTLHGVHVETTDGSRLVIDEAIWNNNGRLVARGPYVLENHQQREAGADGCFLVDLSDTVAIRGPIMGDEDAVLCAPNPLQGQDALGLSAMAVPFPDGEAVPHAQMLPFLSLPTLLPQEPGGHRSRYLKPWLLSIMATGSQQMSQSH